MKTLLQKPAGSHRVHCSEMKLWPLGHTSRLALLVFHLALSALVLGPLTRLRVQPNSEKEQKRVKSITLLYALALVCFCLLPNRAQADPLDQWTWRNPLPTGNGLYAIAYGNGQFAAVGERGTVVTSPDAITWTSRASGTNAYPLYGLAYGNAQFVAVGGGYGFFGSGPGTIVTSPDGITWTSRTSGTTNWLSGIAYGNNQFVAVGGGLLLPTTILTSPDGLTWTNRAPEADPLPDSIAYGNSQFVAVGAAGTIVTSPDGINLDPTPSRNALGASGRRLREQHVRGGGRQRHNPAIRHPGTPPCTTWTRTAPTPRLLIPIGPPPPVSFRMPWTPPRRATRSW